MDGSNDKKNTQMHTHTHNDVATPLPADPPSYEETMKHDKDETEKTAPPLRGPVYTHHPHPKSQTGYPGAQTLTYGSR
ncbi:Cmi8p DI49_0627 [Saccharomyces eubayanus]|uniref:Cmi8p n=1 Tax=Saccharomyces eubayanus TaxID=1080349 RepID=UPI0006C6C818|nr:hypothetical protein DI49_0627 [Saccharomyces eubayanus]KOH01268.1 hypothetical protein DI49_0627 [Saccharomyces eubayanus]